MRLRLSNLNLTTDLCLGDLAPFLLRKSQIGANRKSDQNCCKNPRSESSERNAWSLIVNYLGEPVTTDVVVRNNDYSLKAPISLYQIGSARPAWWWRRWLADDVAAANISDAFQHWSLIWRFNWGNKYAKGIFLTKCFGSRSVSWRAWDFIQVRELSQCEDYRISLFGA